MHIPVKVRGFLIAAMYMARRNPLAVFAFALLLAFGGQKVRADDATADTIVTNVGNITTTATGKYVAAAGLGVSALTVGAIVFMSKRGWRLK